MHNTNPLISASIPEVVQNCVFADNLINESTIAANGGLVNGTVTFDRGAVFNNSGYVFYDNIGFEDTYSATLTIKTSVLSTSVLFGNMDILGTASEFGFCIYCTLDGYIKAFFKNETLGSNTLSVQLDYSDNIEHTITFINDVSGSCVCLYVDDLSSTIEV